MESKTNEANSPGGTLEPGNRATVARQVFQMPHDTPAVRYELRDPFAEITYRASSLRDMAAKADSLGASRFHAIREDGSRTIIAKVDGEWKSASDSERNQAERERDARGRKDPQPVAVAPVAAEAVVARVDHDAERATRVARLEAALFERYLIKRAAIKVGELSVGQTEYRYRGDANRVAFTERTFRLSTDNNNPSVARSMVDVAEARNWQSVRVSGNEDFKRLAWLEASLRGIKALGYEPQLADQELLKREREARAVNRIDAAPTADVSDQTKAGESARGSGGRKAVLAALEAVLVSKGVPAKQRDAVMAAAAEKLAARLRAGEVHKVKIFDKNAPSQRTQVTPMREVQLTRERAAPTR